MCDKGPRLWLGPLSHGHDPASFYKQPFKTYLFAVRLFILLNYFWFWALSNPSPRVNFFFILDDNLGLVTFASHYDVTSCFGAGGYIYPNLLVWCLAKDHSSP